MISIAIIEDDADMTDFLVDTINDAEGMNCHHTYTNAEDALVFIPQIQPPLDVIIVDIGLPNLNGIECVRQLKPRCSERTQFMMHTVFATQEKIFAALKVGATGYLDKDVSPQRIITGIHEMYNKGASISPDIAVKIGDFFRGQKEVKQQETELANLTPSDIRLLKLLAKGNTNREIAETLNIDENTVKQRNYRLFKKMHVKNRVIAINVFMEYYHLFE